MKHDVERRNRNTERRGDFIARSLLQHTQPNRLRVPRVDRIERRVDSRPRIGEVSLFTKLGFAIRCRIVFGCIDFAFEIRWIVKQFPTASAKDVERDAQRHHAQPRVNSSILPLELMKSFDDASVRLGKRILRQRFTTKARQEDGAIKNRAVTPQDLPESSPISRLCSHAELTLGFQIRSRFDDGHGRHDTRMRSRPHRRCTGCVSHGRSRCRRIEPNRGQENRDGVVPG